MSSTYAIYYILGVIRAVQISRIYIEKIKKNNHKQRSIMGETKSQTYI